MLHYWSVTVADGVAPKIKEPLLVQYRVSNCVTFDHTCSPPWFLHLWRAWKVLRAAAVWQRSEFHGRIKLISCFREPGVKLQRQCARKCRWWTSSWCPWLSWRCQCPDELALVLCRYTDRSFLYVFPAFSSSCRSTKSFRRFSLGCSGLRPLKKAW